MAWRRLELCKESPWVWQREGTEPHPGGKADTTVKGKPAQAEAQSSDHVWLALGRQALEEGWVPALLRASVLTLVICL